jgi:predicted glycosyl hydrolase (DUF1957 family)
MGDFIFYSVGRRIGRKPPLVGVVLFGLFIFPGKDDIISGVKIGFLLHLYQPIVQDSGVFKEIAATCYIPLLKLIRSKRNFRLTLNVPLSLLEQMDKYGYQNWIDMLRELVSLEKVELTGSAAYHPLLSKIPKKYVEQQVILNEYGMGYYLGRKTGFEGEPAILIRDLSGFFPPEMAVSMDVVKTLEGLGYSWVLVDETAIDDSDRGNNEENNCVYKLNDSSLSVVVRNRRVSNAISFKRDTAVKEIFDMMDNEISPLIICLDGEFFGHHFKEGLYLLDVLIDLVHDRRGIFTTVTEIVEDEIPNEIYEINESTWGASDQEMSQGDVYPFWDAKGNKIHEIQWQIVNEIMSKLEDVEKHIDMKDYETIPIWNDNVLNSMPNNNLQNIIKKDLLVNKSLNSDQFWWASNKLLQHAGLLYHPGFVKKTLEMHSEVVNLIGDPQLQKSVEEKISRINNLLDNPEDAPPPSAIV